MALSAPQRARPTAWSRFGLVGFGTVVVAVLANVLVYGAGRRLTGDDEPVGPLADVSATVLFTVVPAVAAVLLYAVLLRLTGDPARTFTQIAVAVFFVTLGLDVVYLLSVHGATVEQTAILILMHLVAAGVIVGMLTSHARPQTQ
jgi:hypothetical protein